MAGLSPNERLERMTWDLFWVPPDVTVVDRPELLALHTPRPLHYLNAVYRVRATDTEAPALVDEVRRLHGDGLSRWNLPNTTDTSALERCLEANGYSPAQVHDARVIATADYRPRPSPGLLVERVVDERGLRDAWAVADAAFGIDGGYADDDVPIELAQCAAADARVQRFVAYLDGEPVAAGGLNLYPALGFGFLWAGGTVPRARHRGAYSAIVAARIACAAARGIEYVGLYARVASSSPVLAAQGFANVGRMTYWDSAADEASAKVPGDGD